MKRTFTHEILQVLCITNFCTAVAWGGECAANELLVPPTETEIAPMATRTYTGSTYTYTMPSGSNALRFHIWGAGGGGAHKHPDQGCWLGAGGAGGYVTGVITGLSAGTRLKLEVGGKGLLESNVPSDFKRSWPDGGSTKPQELVSHKPSARGGTGGGSTRIETNGGLPIAIAGGGGGGGCVMDRNRFPQHGGGGGFTHAALFPKNLEGVGYWVAQPVGGQYGGHSEPTPDTVNKYAGPGGGGGYTGGAGVRANTQTRSTLPGAFGGTSYTTAAVKNRDHENGVYGGSTGTKSTTARSLHFGTVTYARGGSANRDGNDGAMAYQPLSYTEGGCYCVAGITRPEGGGGCTVTCPVGFYCAGGTEEAAVACPTESPVCPEGSTSITACSSDTAGYYSTNGVWHTCPEDHYCPGDGSLKPCPEHASAPAQSGAAQSCVCNQGFHGADGGECAGCPHDFYCTGGSSIEPCPHGSSAEKGSSTSSACECKAGYYDAAVV